MSTPIHPPIAIFYISNISLLITLNKYAPPPIPSVYTIIIVYKIVLIYFIK